MALNYSIEVTQGIIHVNSVAPLYVSETALLFEADTKQKYPELLTLGMGCITFGANKQTLKVTDPRADPSRIYIRLIGQQPPLESGMWHTMVEAGRYSIFIGMFLVPDELECKTPYWVDGELIDPTKKDE